MTISERTLIAVLLTFAVASIVTPLVRQLGLRYHWLDEPNHRSSHSAPVPRVGGVAFIAATLLGIAVSSAKLEWWMLGIGLGALLVAATGLLDDISPLGPAMKFLPQIGAATIAVVLLDPRILVELPIGTVTFSPAVSAGLTLVWIVSVINAFNFLDGLDGLAAGVGMVTAVALAGMLPGSAPLLVPFAAALAGFLLWNTAPASIFMGDVGSQFVGYLLATSVLMPGPTDTGAVPVLFAFVPVLGDAAVTIGRRLLRGDSPFAGDRTHVFHGFVRALESHRAVAILYAALTALAGMAGLAYMYAGTAVKVMLLLMAVLSVIASIAMFANVRVILARQQDRIKIWTGQHNSAREPGDQQPTTPHTDIRDVSSTESSRRV